MSELYNNYMQFLIDSNIKEREENLKERRGVLHNWHKAIADEVKLHRDIGYTEDEAAIIIFHQLDEVRESLSAESMELFSLYLESELEKYYGSDE